jgi:hypothetical protein
MPPAPPVPAEPAAGANESRRRGSGACGASAGLEVDLRTGGAASTCTGARAGLVAAGSGAERSLGAMAAARAPFAERAFRGEAGGGTVSSLTAGVSVSTGANVGNSTGANVGNSTGAGTARAGTGGVTTGSSTTGGAGGSGSVTAGGAGGSGGVTGGEIPLLDSGGLIGWADGAAGQIESSFQFQIHPWIPVSIGRVISPRLVSPQLVTVRFHTHVCGICVAGAGVGVAAVCVDGAGATGGAADCDGSVVAAGEVVGYCGAGA